VQEAGILMYRLFVAIDFPPWVIQELTVLCFGLRGARWFSEDQMHLTIRFIGEVEGGVLRDAVAALRSVAAEPLELELEGVGVFPSKRAPEVLWVGVKKSDALLQFRRKVDSALAQAGIPRESRKLSPHVTIARLKSTPVDHVARFVAGNNLFKTQPFTAERFCLYSSFLASQGAIHTVEAEYELYANRSMQE